MTDSVLLASLTDAVAAPDDNPDAGVAWHFGDPLGEQRAATTAGVIVDRSHRGVIELTGDDRLSWLHTISSQFVSDLADGESAENLSLDGNGRVEDHFVLSDVDGRTLIDTEPHRASALSKFLTSMVFWAKVIPADRPDIAVLTLIGPAAIEAASSAGVPADAPIYRAGRLSDDSGIWRRMPNTGTDRALPVVDILTTEPLHWWRTLTDAGLRPAGAWTAEALRVAAMRPRLGADTDDRTIAHEVGWIGGRDEQGAVHLDKGCYRGQETVARVHNLGQPPRRMVLLHLDGSADATPVTGSAVTAGGRNVGRVGTVAQHFELGPIALALVKRNVPVDTDLIVTVDDAPVAATIDPDSVTEAERVQAGRAAIERLRGGGRAQ